MLKKYVKIQFAGYSPERFLNMCKHKEIKIWGLETNESGYQCCIYVRDFKKIKGLVKKSKLKIRIIERHGMGFQLFHYRKRKIFILGVFFSLFIIYILTRRVWNIEIQGNQSITDDVLLEYLENQYIYLGMKREDVNCEEICKKMRLDFQDIIWVSASLEGTKLKIEIRENTDTFSVVEENKEYRDIIADVDGVITAMITRKGNPAVKIGDKVKAGDLLVSGKLEIMNDAGEIIREEFVNADADIYIKRIISYRDSCDDTHEMKLYYKTKKTILCMDIFSYQICLGIHKKSGLHEVKTMHTNIGSFLSFTKKVSQAYERNLVAYEEAEQVDLLQNTYEHYKNQLIMQGIEIISEDMNFVDGEKALIYMGEIEVIQQVVDLY